MHAFFARFSFQEASWILAFLYLVHYLEEGPRLVKWFRDHSCQRKFGLSYNQKKLNLENALMFSILLAIIALLNVFPGNALLQALILGACVAFLENVFFHAVPTLVRGVYSPGVITACLFNPAACAFLFRKAAQAHALSGLTIIIALAFGTVILPSVVLITHKLLLSKE